ncbi:MAG: hypothetical protein AB7W28_09280 [Armatimonadota bacterium]
MPRMSGRQLEQLSTDDLIEVILRQQEIQKILEPQQARIEHLEAPGAYLQHVQPISRDRLEKLMKQVFGLHLNQGAIANIIRLGGKGEGGGWTAGKPSESGEGL